MKIKRLDTIGMTTKLWGNHTLGVCYVMYDFDERTSLLFYLFGKTFVVWEG